MPKSTRSLRTVRTDAGDLPPVALGGEVVLEPDLPFPWVAYPGHYGTFHTFAADAEGPWRLCACAQAAVDNLAELAKADSARWGTPTPRRLGLPDHAWLPTPAPWEHVGDPLDEDIWAPAACHRCNLVTPSLRWAHEMYETQFNQFHGWYTAQAMARGGFARHTPAHATSAAPNLVRLRAVAEPWTTLPASLHEPFSHYRGARADGTAIIASEEEIAMEMARREAIRQALPKPNPQAGKRWRRMFQDEARTEFGYRKVGDGFVAETQLFAMVARLLRPSEEIVRHHRPKWLEGLELDIWVPRVRLGIEYQGQQHYVPISAWGGETALCALQTRDERKRLLCASNDVDLIEIAYIEPLTRDHLAGRLEGYLGEAPPAPPSGS